MTKMKKIMLPQNTKKNMYKFFFNRFLIDGEKRLFD